MQESRCRATNLLDLLKEARELSKEKCYDTSEGKTKNGKSRRYSIIYHFKVFIFVEHYILITLSKFKNRLRQMH